MRLEFLGDTIETLRTYDPATQRSTAPIDQLTVVPLVDRLADDLSASIFDYLARAKESRVLVSEPDEVKASLDKHSEQVHRSFDEMSGRATPRPAVDDIDITALDVDEDDDDADERTILPMNAGPSFESTVRLKSPDTTYPPPVRTLRRRRHNSVAPRVGHRS